MPSSALHSSGARHCVSGLHLRTGVSRYATSRRPTCSRALPSDPIATNHTGGTTGTSTSSERLLREVLDQLNTLNKGTKKLTQQVQRLEDRIGELYEFTSLPIIANHFGNEFSESADLTSATTIVDHLLTLAINLELPALKQRSVLISTLEDYVLKDRQGLRAALGSLINEACDERGVCMVAIPSNFRTCGWDDVRACLQELQLGYGCNGSAGADERISNLLRLVDALELGSPPRPLPGFVEMATALAMGRCLSAVSLDCRGRIDVRETYIEFHIGAFKGANSGIFETCALLRNAAALLSWTYRVLEPSLHTYVAGRSPRDVQTIGYAFKVGKVTPAESALLKLYDEFSIEAHGSRSTADVAYRYFSVRPTGISEHYAKS